MQNGPSAPRSRILRLAARVMTLAVAPAATAGDPLSGPGPYQPGNRTVTVPRGNGTTFSALLYYPATSAGANTPYDGSGGPYPGISFGHGFLTAPTRYEGTLQHLATWGYWVMATQSGLELFPNHAAYAQDLSLCLTYLEQQNAKPASQLFGQVDVERFGLSGHSMGGGASILATATDSRVKAIANLAAANTNPSAIAAVANVRAPLCLLAGDEDTITPNAQHVFPIYANAEAPRILPLIDGGYHCGFLDNPQGFGCDTGSLPRSEQLAITRRTLTAFFNLYLRGDQTLWRRVWGPEAGDDPLVDVTRLDAGIQIAPAHASAGGPPGSTVAIEFTLTNSGPTSTTYSLFVEDNLFAIELSLAQTPDVPAGQATTFTAWVTIPADSPGINDQAWVSARSDRDGGTRGYAELSVRQVAPGDCDSDGDFDLADWPAISACLQGPTAIVSPPCGCADSDLDQDADLRDFAAMAVAFSL